jgi:hypothetical protein
MMRTCLVVGCENPATWREVVGQRGARRTVYVCEWCRHAIRSRTLPMPQFEDGEHVHDEDATGDGAEAMPGVPTVADDTDRDGESPL